MNVQDHSEEISSIPSWLERTELLVSKKQLLKLQKTHVLVVGLGGVGSAAAEMICRSGVGQMTIVDGDVVQASNRNRQLIALKSNEGLPKAQLMAERLKDINPDLKLLVHNQYVKDQAMIDILEAAPYDYVVDAIDTLSPKIYLLFHARRLGLKVISSMGAGGKYDPSQIRICDLSKTTHCAFAFDIRKRLRRLGITDGIMAVFSPEVVSKRAVVATENEKNKKSTVGTISYMPPVFGCFCASVVIRELLEIPVI